MLRFPLEEVKLWLGCPHTPRAIRGRFGFIAFLTGFLAKSSIIVCS